MRSKSYLCVILLCYAASASGLSSLPPSSTYSESNVYIALGKGPIYWFKFSCTFPSTGESLKNCRVSAVANDEGECLEFSWKKTEVVPWNWPERYRPNSNFIQVLDLAYGDVFEANDSSTSNDTSLLRVTILRPNDTVGSTKKRLPVFLELESLGKLENSLPKVQHLVQVEDRDISRFSQQADRRCIGETTRFLKTNP